MKRSRTFFRPMGTRRRRLLFVAASVLIASLVFVSGALANWDSVESGGSPNANAIETLYIIVEWVALFVFIAVEGTLVYAIWRFRAKKHPVAEQFHGNTRVELGLTAFAAGILVVLAAATFITLPHIVNPPNSDAGAGQVLSASLENPIPPSGRELTICVVGRQFIWQYVYGAGCNNDGWQNRDAYSFQEMVVPAGVTVRLVIQSRDVIHDWWIPKLGPKTDADPGYTTYTWFKALHAGATYYGQCAQLCGRGHAFMTAQVKVVTPSQYVAFLAQQKKAIANQNVQVGALRQSLMNGNGLSSNGVF